MNILLLSPYRPTTHPALLARAAELRAALIAAHPEHTIEVDCRPGVSTATGHRYAPHADVRNAFLVASLRERHERVLWVDIDLIDYPADLVRRLLVVCPDGIAAPAVVMDRYGGFYDIGGFIQPGGRPFNIQRPWCDAPGPVVDLESVGCLYLVPAWVYRAGAHYAPTGPVYGVEHYPVCAFARSHGCPVRADLSIVARHAYPPDYGEAL